MELDLNFDKLYSVFDKLFLAEEAAKEAKYKAQKNESEAWEARKNANKKAEIVRQIEEMIYKPSFSQKLQEALKKAYEYYIYYAQNLDCPFDTYSTWRYYEEMAKQCYLDDLRIEQENTIKAEEKLKVIKPEQNESNDCLDCSGWDHTAGDCYRRSCIHNRHKYGSISGASDLFPNG